MIGSTSIQNNVLQTYHKYSADVFSSNSRHVAAKFARDPLLGPRTRDSAPRHGQNQTGRVEGSTRPVSIYRDATGQGLVSVVPYLALIVTASESAINT